MKNVTIMSTGNELLSGAAVDTNAAFIAGRLFPLDVRVLMILVTGDGTDDLARALRCALEQSDIIIVTGGLGPTDDDNTIEALRVVMRSGVVIDGEARRRMEDFFGRTGLPVSPGDLKMAEVPEGASVIPNETGLAPGFVLQSGDATVIALPGVPREMREMMDRHVVPFLTGGCGIRERRSLTVRVIGVKESDINDRIRSLDVRREGLEWGITTEDGIAALTFVEAEGAAAFDGLRDRLGELFGCRILGPGYRSPEEEVVGLLRERGLTVALAESCTGGLAAKRITDVPGASEVFAGGVVAYRNDAKASLLGVSPDTIARFGAVSEETAAEMAEGARRVFRSHIAVSVTGIAGPGGGSPAKPVGTVCFGLVENDAVTTLVRSFGGDRGRVRTFASLAAIELLRECLKGPCRG